MKKTLRFKIVDILLILMMILPFLCGMTLRVLTKPASEGISITGALVFWPKNCDPGSATEFHISEATVNSWLVMISITAMALYLTHGIRAGVQCRRTIAAEWIVEKTDSLVAQNMGPLFREYSPFIAAILGLSAFSSLSSLVGMFPATSDFSTIFGWALLVFILITYYKLKGGTWNYIKGYFEPIPFFAPLNVIGEVARPISMSFRHYGNILSGSVISALIASALGGLSRSVLGALPGALGQIPFLQIGIPAVLSVYFDVFSGCLQAFIFAMLTMLNISGGFPEELYNKRQEKKAARKARKSGEQEQVKTAA
ncbi:MAG: F0F1 ATP synthase subunit A [Clostridia bacterium]|nr:F0F1 ATP synthase subunit A [Clostridia bacterium]MBR6006673.1 F0F1 ATP synthase subunit A [Clostridia bacterium]